MNGVQNETNCKLVSSVPVDLYAIERSHSDLWTNGNDEVDVPEDHDLVSAAIAGGVGEFMEGIFRQFSIAGLSLENGMIVQHKDAT